MYKGKDNKVYLNLNLQVHCNKIEGTFFLINMLEVTAIHQYILNDFRLIISYQQ